MRHFTDYVCVAYGVEAVGSDHIAVEVYALVLRFVLALGESGYEAQHQGRYDKQAFQSIGFGRLRYNKLQTMNCFFYFCREKFFRNMKAKAFAIGLFLISETIAT